MSNQLLVNLPILFDKPTGIATYAANLFPHLKSLNPTLLISSIAAQHFPLASEFTSYPIPGNLTPAQGTKGHFRRLVWTQFQLPDIYQNLKSSLLFSPIPEAPLYTNCRYVVTVHDLIPLRFPKKFSPLIPYFRYYIPQVLYQAQHIICDSKATASDIIDFYNIPASKITPILLGYNSNNFGKLGVGSGEWGEKNRKKKCPYFLYLGRHDPYKNIHRLIDAFAAMANCRDYELWIAGSADSRYTPILQTKVYELGLKNQVKFLDYVTYGELPIIINAAIALVFPSLWEGFGLPVLEAMACGTPVITSNLSSLPEVTGDAAILINPYNTGEITAAMEAIARDNNLRSRLSHLSLARASQFSWEKTGKATREILAKYI
ncbi:MAG TPA: mannosyltransferase [Cyanobacteria bacterium UBA11149]|nr:mannosyltransferase [Cyanobacteria bacterium UBA11367]HBE59800.1 mannosyltransferase [Cyanobacteria bacterium UBA11366]HBK64287.1 mannosyltransferase [Cyanobacteria bacterium UBA11166]HBR72375.1 mannosyltransferase [Cyanobacteria bacterium UBA11159]HBS70840.1 mannosyltransferase [Cyanobacteria bacterium UBA11153]HBW89544.1 mannosyltransferase [Cyanobacteria bacterium UBA11149]HCA94292.1 mannosyltransferase [Cyanobacteria bacterium UBA9226]